MKNTRIHQSLYALFLAAELQLYGEFGLTNRLWSINPEFPVELQFCNQRLFLRGGIGSGMSMYSTLCVHMILCKRSWLHAFNKTSTKNIVNCGSQGHGGLPQSALCVLGGGGAVGCVGVRSWRGVGLYKCSYCYKLKLKKIYYLLKKIKTRNSCH